MSSPISWCELRRALDTNNWDKIDAKMRYNNRFGAFTLCPCRCGKCEFTKQEAEKAHKRLFAVWRKKEEENESNM